jgi:hypothetical protein
MTNPRATDRDYAAIAVKAAIVEKFGRTNELQSLDVTANERTIVVRDVEHVSSGTRDDLLAAVRAADSYARLWELLPTHANSDRGK